MPFYTDDKVGPANYGLQDFKPTYGQSLSAAWDATLEGNPTAVGFNLADMYYRNQGASERLTAYDAEAVIKDAGVTGLTVRDGQYNRDALDMLIERKRQESIRADVMGRTEYSWSGTPVRGLAMLAGSIIDPLNIAAAFIPVVGEARVASMLARSAVGSMERAGTRAAIGVAEGGVGAAMIEPFVYAGRTQLQDDYHMSDSLLNIAFGAALGGGLHVTAGQLADKFRASDPYTRFQGLDSTQVRTILDFERALNPEMTQPRINDAISDWTPKMREAAGLGPRVADATPANGQSLDIPRSMSREDFAKLYEAYPREVVESIANRVGQREMPDVPFAKLADTTPEGARQMAVRELTDSMRADLLATAGNRAAPGEVLGMKSQLADIAQKTDALEAQFKPLAKELQKEGKSRKQAEAGARKELADRKDDLDAQRSAIESKIDQNRQASRAEQDIATLARGEVPESMRQQVDDRASQIMGQADVARVTQPTAASIVGAATPEVRQAAFRAALAQAVSGRLPDVDALVRGGYTLDQMKSIAARQQSADSLAIGDPAASRNATTQLKESPRETGLKEAEEELAKVTEMLGEFATNLEQSGMKKERVSQIMDQLKVFDDEIAKSENYRAAAKAAAICGIRG